MWQKNPGEKMTHDKAVSKASSFNLAGYSDWRLPTIKELYSLIQFNGIDPITNSDDTSSAKPFIDTNYFDFEYGSPDSGERIIDSQFASSTKYVISTMNGDETAFGVNFADGHIKGYGLITPKLNEGKTFFVLYMRGNKDYGKNAFKDNDETITDNATGLMWSKADSKKGMNWQNALAWVQQKNKEKYLGYNDWRLPNAKELQSIVDYSRSPDTTNSPAIDPIFTTSSITNEGDNKDYPFFWTSTTHVSSLKKGANAAYIAFGRGLGWIGEQSGTGDQQQQPPKRSGNNQPPPQNSNERFAPSSSDYNLLDVHGASCQRSDPKIGNPDDYPQGRGPQGDVIRIYNYIRLVRDID